ncbi:MAG TPA: YaeQ family protein [Burkholderiales bacterium]|nr:YaeQ family protein [Burkholderiales bacterium]
MASGAIIHKTELQIADMDRNYYQTHSLTVACHPSETNERMMVRIVAFTLYAHESLAFGRGLSAQDEPDLWLKNLTGGIDLWIDVGQPDERDIRRACNRAKAVAVVCYGGRGVDLWWSQNRDKLERLSNLTVISLPLTGTQALARLVNRTMRLQCNIQERQVTVIGGSDIVQIEPTPLLSHGL